MLTDWFLYLVAGGVSLGLVGGPLLLLLSWFFTGVATPPLRKARR